jgi:hypothetical protein
VDDPADVERAGAWAISAMHGWGVVSGLVPDAFERFARIFHPALREAPEDAGPWREVSWREVADANGRIAHPAMEWTAITGSYELSWGGMQPGLWDQVPKRGSLPQRVARALCEVLGAYTTTPERCWCAVWEGHEDLIGLRSDAALPRLAAKHRPMIVAEGPLNAVPEKSFSDPAPVSPPGQEHPPVVGHYRSPSLWWPADRAWCVASDVDLQTTYVGASSDCVDRLIADNRIEVMPVTADQSTTIDADTVNPPPAGDRERA